MHEPHELADQVRRAGAQAIVSKSDAHGLIAAIESLEGDGTSIHLAGSVVGASRHVAAFFRSETERYRVVAPFTAEGLTHGEKAVHIIDAPGQDGHVQRLKEAGIDVDRAASQHQMDLVSWEDLYLRDGYFDQHATIERLDGLLTDASAQGFPLARLVANMEWALEPRPGVDDLVEYETRINYLLTRFDDVVICAYDLRKFPGSIIMDVMRTHPAIVIEGSFRENPLYVPPDQMIEELRRRSA